MDVKFNNKVVSRAKILDSFFSRFKGLMFSKKLNKSESLIFVLDSESRFNSMIHMLFVFFSIDVVFLDSSKKVVDVRKAYPFISFILPKAKSKYVIEMNAGENILKIGDKITF